MFLAIHSYSVIPFLLYFKPFLPPKIVYCFVVLLTIIFYYCVGSWNKKVREKFLIFTEQIAIRNFILTYKLNIILV